MIPVWLNRSVKDDEERRARMYAGEIFVYDRLSSVAEFANFTQRILEAALAPHDPRHVHETLTPAELASILGRLKPLFTHHPQSRCLVKRILEEVGVDLVDCHMDVPKLRTAYPTWHLTKGIAYAFPPHRDTWYGGPQAQINWWMPIYPLQPDNSMGFYPRYFSEPARNDSSNFNYYQRNAERKDTAKYVSEDPRVQPAAQVPENEPEIRVLPEVGGIILFSGAQLHRTVTHSESLSRYSVDFRTVSERDVQKGLGAANVDSNCMGTALRDFRRAHDNAPIPEELALLLDPIGPEPTDVKVFEG